MKLVVGNFKMNLTLEEINDYLEFYKKKKYDNVIFAPSSIYLSKFVDSGLVVSSQDVSFASLGAYTGDIAAVQLKSIGVKYSIVGHSERRKYYQDDKYVNDKLKELLKEEIIPILSSKNRTYHSYCPSNPIIKFCTIIIHENFPERYIF